MALYFKSCLVWLKFAVHTLEKCRIRSLIKCLNSMSTLRLVIHVHVYTAVHISRWSVFKLAVPLWSKWSFLEQVLLWSWAFKLVDIVFDYLKENIFRRCSTSCFNWASFGFLTIENGYHFTCGDENHVFLKNCQKLSVKKLNTSYLTNSCIVFTLKMKSVSKNTPKNDGEKWSWNFFLKFLHAEAIFF